MKRWCSPADVRAAGARRRSAAWRSRTWTWPWCRPDVMQQFLGFNSSFNINSMLIGGW